MGRASSSTHPPTSTASAACSNRQLERAQSDEVVPSLACRHGFSELLHDLPKREFAMGMGQDRQNLLLPLGDIEVDMLRWHVAAGAEPDRDAAARVFDLGSR